jgi:hypothetical protein
VTTKYGSLLSPAAAGRGPIVVIVIVIVIVIEVIIVIEVAVVLPSAACHVIRPT